MMLPDTGKAGDIRKEDLAQVVVELFDMLVWRMISLVDVIG